MLEFIKGFLGNLPAIQTKQILRLLSQMRDRGEIRNASEFNDKLLGLSKLIQSDEQYQRTEPVTFTNGELLESDAIRTFLENAKLDIEAALGESERLSNVLRAHRGILADNYFSSIESALDELESDITAYEVLSVRKFEGFSKVQKIYNFSGAVSVPGANEEDPSVSTLLTDSRGARKLYFSPPRKGEQGLHLPVDYSSGERVHLFDKVEIVADSTTPQTALNTSTSDNVPSKAIDGNPDTSWRYSVLLTEHPDVCRLKLKLSFVGAQRINAVAIDSLADVPMKIVEMSYTDAGGMEQGLGIGSTGGTSYAIASTRSRLLGNNESPTLGWSFGNSLKTIPVGDIIAKDITITFQQDTGGDGEFFYFDADIGSWQKGYIEDQTTVFGVQWIYQDPSEVNSAIPTELGFIDPTESGIQRAAFIEYVFGLKDVYALSREFRPDGRFIPEPMLLSEPPRVLALHTDIETPTNEHVDVEFIIRKENFSSSDQLIDVESIPLIPYGTSELDERIFLSRRFNSLVLNDAGSLRFYPDFSEDFKVFKEDVELTIGTDYQVSVDGGVTWESTTVPVATPLIPRTCLVKLASPRTDSIFRVEYTPLASTPDEGGEIWLNSIRTVRLGKYYTYVFDNNRPGGKVDHCKIIMQIIPRANTLNTRVSPYLREVVILGG